MSALSLVRFVGHASRASKGKTVTPPPTSSEKKEDDKAKAKIKIDNPAYEEWFAADQQVLGFLFHRSRIYYPELPRRPRAMRKMIGDVQLRDSALLKRLAISHRTRKEPDHLEYFAKMKALADELTASGKQCDAEELTAFILNGLDDDYDSVVSALAAKTEPITLSKHMPGY